MSGIYQKQVNSGSVASPSAGSTLISVNESGELFTKDSSGNIIVYGSGSSGSAFPFTGSAEISGSVVINSQLTLGVGPGASSYTPTGNTYNVAIGYNNLQNNTTGFSNIALGYSALGDNTEGNLNIALGVSALRNNTTGSGNIALGYSVLRSNTTGNQNTALGGGALLYNTTGYYNVALGGGSLYANTTGDNNTALGIGALFSNTTGYKNVAIGRNALYSNISGSFNAGLGYQVQSGDYSGSVMLGAQATSTANGQLALGSSYHPIGPVASEVLVSNKTLQINLNGNLYKILMYRA